MFIQTFEELDALLKKCKAIPASEVMDGGKFYKLKSQLFTFPDGKIQGREYLDKRRASVVVPVTNEGNVVLIVQPIALSEEGSLVEFPAGYFEFNETGSEAGIRELGEETGYVPESIVYLGSHYQDPGSIRQKVDTFLALGCKKLTDQHLDKGEFIKYIEVPYEFVSDLMDNGYLLDANSFISFNKASRYLEKNLNKNNSSIR